jgi:ATP-binding cassette subfamily F protein 3
LEFNGTVLFVSHDRYFLNRVADHLLVVDPGRFRVIEGNYDLYLHYVREGLAGVDTTKTTAPEQATPKAPPEKSVKRKRRFPYRKVVDLESEIFERETRIAELHAQLANPEVLRNGNRVRQIHSEIASQQETLKTLYEHWEEATELNPS